MNSSQSQSSGRYPNLTYIFLTFFTPLFSLDIRFAECKICTYWEIKLSSRSSTSVPGYSNIYMPLKGQKSLQQFSLVAACKWQLHNLFSVSAKSENPWSLCAMAMPIWPVHNISHLVLWKLVHYTHFITQLHINPFNTLMPFVACLQSLHMWRKGMLRYMWQVDVVMELNVWPFVVISHLTNSAHSTTIVTVFSSINWYMSFSACRCSIHSFTLIPLVMTSN